MVVQTMCDLLTGKDTGTGVLQVPSFALSNIIPPILHKHVSVIKGTNDWHISAVPRDVVELITDNGRAGEEKQHSTWPTFV
jgi:hypothetical protein